MTDLDRSTRDAPPSDSHYVSDRAFVVRVLHGIVMIPSMLLIGFVRLYQIFLSPLFGGQCRFDPSCSAYFIQAVRKYGAISGSARGVWRILRCHPYHPGGYDPP